MKKRLSVMTIAGLFIVGFMSASAFGNVTLATFADPSAGSSNYLFNVDFTQMEINGGWSDGQTGLTLEIPCSGYTVENGNAFEDVWFEMSTVNITTASTMSGQTGAGMINFYANGTSANPLLTINFASGMVSRRGFGSNELFIADNVTITSSKISDIISEEQFSFSFANLVKLPGSADWNDGFTATAAFTSSAVITPSLPEPATVCLLGIGIAGMIRRKNSHK